MDQNHDGTVTRKEFIDVYLRAEAILKEKIHQCEQVIADCQRQRQEVERKLEQASRTERMNAYSIKEGSVASVMIKEVSGIRAVSSTRILARIICGEEYYESTPVVYRGMAKFDQTINV